MRDFFASLLTKIQDWFVVDTSNVAPEDVGWHVLGVTARVLVGGSLLAAPVAITALIQGIPLPFIVMAIGLGGGYSSLAYLERRSLARGAAAQSGAVLAAGSVVALLDPALLDFGLVLALLAPANSALAGRELARKVTAIAVAAATLLAVLPIFPGLKLPASAGVELVGAVALAVVLGNGLLATYWLNAAASSARRGRLDAYRHLVENVPDAVLHYDAAGRLTFSSRSSERLFGCRSFELTGDGLLERVHILDRPAYLTALAEAVRDGTPRRIELRMRRDDPHQPARVPEFVWIEMALTPAGGDAKEARARDVVAILRDVSDRRHREAEMADARRRMEEASLAKSRFLATIGHELRTPLNAIVGFSEMMTSGVVGEMIPAHREYATIIHQSGHHLLDLVRTLLDMGRLEAGKFELATESFDPAGLVDPCLAMVDAAARARSIRIVTNLARHLPTITADERACRQMLINLLANAVKFSHEGGTVTVAMKRQGALLNIAVSDTGIGMDEAAVRRIGEPFFQAQNGLTRPYEGTGLGLSIVKGLVDLHQGALRVASRPGEGTTVTILLPINGPAGVVNNIATITEIAEHQKSVAIGEARQTGRMRAQ